VLFGSSPLELARDGREVRRVIASRTGRAARDRVEREELRDDELAPVSSGATPSRVIVPIIRDA